MKQLSQQKWILSSLLIAALGSQYYFSTNSTNHGVYEMSQLASAGEESIINVNEALLRAVDQLPTITPIKTTSGVVVHTPSDQAKPAAAPASTPAVTAAIASAKDCPGCTVLTAEQTAKLRTLLQKIKEGKDIKITVTGGASDPNETESERLRREREEREDAKRLKDELKKEREIEKKRLADERKKDRQDRIDDRFASSFERKSSKCSDLKCYSDAFAETLSSYNDKDYSASPSLVAKLFKEKVGSDLKERLKDPSDTEAVDALRVIMEKFPKEFSALKKQTVDMAKAVAMPLAKEANEKFKQADQLSRQGKVQDATIVRESAFQQKTELESIINAHKEAIHNGTYEVKDSATMSYYKKTYGDPSQKWLQDIMNTTNYNIDGTSSGSSSTANPRSRGVVRGGQDNAFTRTGNNTGSPTVQQGNILWNQQQGQRQQRGAY